VSIQKKEASGILRAKSNHLARRIPMPQKKRSWMLQRQYLAKPEGWSRWDQAYQALLAWSSNGHQPTNEQEEANENCHLRASFDPASLRRTKRSNNNWSACRPIASTSVGPGRKRRYARDEGYSGATLRRPGWDRLRDQESLGGFDQILITAPDRLARKYVHQMLLIEEFEGRGSQVSFVDRPLSQDPNDQLLLQIRGAVAEYERTLIGSPDAARSTAQISSRLVAALDSSSLWLSQ
jgi:hypothetical protein